MQIISHFILEINMRQLYSEFLIKLWCIYFWTFILLYITFDCFSFMINSGGFSPLLLIVAVIVDLVSKLLLQLQG